MLVCPQCQFENPNSNKFCQSCGTSLTWKICTQCGTKVALDAEHCSSCNAPVGIYWRAIVRLASSAIAMPTAKKDPPTLPDGEIPQFPIPEMSLSLEDWINGTATIAPIATNIDPEITVAEEKKTQTDVGCNIESLLDRFPEGYLDIKSASDEKKGRYRIIANASSKIYCDSMSQWFQIKVLDCQPWQKSPIAILSQKYPESFDRFNAEPTEENKTQLCQQTGIPTIALPYLQLERLTPTIPPIYDAWSADDLEICLVDDRSDLQIMEKLWQEPDLNYLQLAWWLDEMLKIWTGLCRSNCTRSLLEPENLRVDEDRSLCLQQLYPNSPDTPVTLADLARMLQQWLQQAETLQHEGLHRLLQEVISGRIHNETQLRAFMQNAALAQLFAIDIEDSPSQNIGETQIQSKTTMPEISSTELSEHQEAATMALPMKLLSITEVGCTDVGNQRDHNEDCFTIETEIKTQENGRGKSISAKGIYIVCDGMGGHAAGEVASAMAIESLQSYFYTYWQDEMPDRSAIEQGILLANQTLYKENLSHSRSGNGRMGTTLAMALIQDDRLAIAHVGDSRIYRITRSQGLEQLTIDHEVGQRDILRGVDPDIAYARPDAYQLTQALGPRDNNFVKPEIKYSELTEDCLLLLCSDGLSDNYLLEDHWQAYLSNLISSSANLEEGLSKLVDFANDFNGHDNITAVLVRIKLQPNLDLLPN
jgi:protein phosphatase